MAIQYRTRRSLGNPLIRRVQRHADLATLFRSPQAAYSGLESQPTGITSSGLQGAPVPARGAGPASAGVPLVRATLIPVSSWPSEAETSAVVGPETAIRPAAAHPRISRQQDEALPTYAEEPAPVKPITQRSSPAPDSPAVIPPGLQRAPEPAAQTKPASQLGPAAQSVQEGTGQPEAKPSQTQMEVPAAGSGDSMWNRLQAILRKHQEQETQEPAAGEEEATPTQESAGKEAGKAQVQAMPDNEPEENRGAEERLPSEPTASEAGEAEVKSEQRVTAPRTTIQEQPQPAQVQRAAMEPGIKSDQEADAPGESGVQATPPTRQPVPPSLDEVAASDQSVEALPDQSVEEPDKGTDEAGLEVSEPEGEQDETQVAMPPMIQRKPLPAAPPEATTQPSAPKTEPPGEPETGMPAQKTVDLKPAQVDKAEEPRPTAKDEMQAREPQTMSRAAPAEAARPSLPPDVFAPVEAEEPEGQQDFRPLPLEDVWPVERLAAAEPPGAETAQPAPSAALASSPEARQVSSLLQDVTPGQPTVSKVEVVTPRRPRPVAVQTSRQEQPAVTAEEKKASEKTTTASTTEAEAAKPEQREAAPASEAALRSEAQGQPSLVPTEIGALPADLWRLIGQELPQSSSSASRPAVSLQRQVEPDQTPAAPDAQAAHTEPEAFGQVFTYQSRPPVQRADALEGAAPAAAAETAAAAPQGEAGNEEGGEEGVNLDELSRRVYQDVKRRLMNEWERMRRRL